MWVCWGPIRQRIGVWVSHLAVPCESRPPERQAELWAAENGANPDCK